MINSSLCLQHLTVKEHGAVSIQLHTFLTFSKIRMRGFLHGPASLMLGNSLRLLCQFYRWTGGLPRTGQDAFEVRPLYPLPKFEPRCLGLRAGSQVTVPTGGYRIANCCFSTCLLFQLFWPVVLFKRNIIESFMNLQIFLIIFHEFWQTVYLTGPHRCLSVCVSTIALIISHVARSNLRRR